MNKRQKKKLGLPYQKIKTGSRVLIIENTMDGHDVGTFGYVININDSEIYEVLGKCKSSGRKISFFQCANELKLKNQKRWVNHGNV